MIPYLVIPLFSFLASALTLVSGFGLNTILLPVFTLFFPVPAAVALTAVVHLLNNLTKLAFFGKHADRNRVLLFGLPALGAAFLGAKVFIGFSHFDPVLHYSLLGREIAVLPVKIVIAGAMIFFALEDFIFREKKRSGGELHWILGGLLSGFFGGLSGHQGAFRSSFLVKSGLPKESFIGTGVVIACLVDLARLFVYRSLFNPAQLRENSALILLAFVPAFLGIFLGSYWVKKVTFQRVRQIVTGMLLFIALGLAAGLI